jgi:hypothetical protein
MVVGNLNVALTAPLSLSGWQKMFLIEDCQLSGL